MQLWPGRQDPRPHGLPRLDEGPSDVRTLAQATEGMYRDGTYMRVYWEGAAMLLIADVRLRQMTAGKQSLDTALAALNDCCAATDRAWSARELFDKLDEVTGTGVFREIYDQHVASTNFPDLSETYRALGVAIGAGGIELSTEARQRRLRDAIMATGAFGFDAMHFQLVAHGKIMGILGAGFVVELPAA